MGSRLAVPVALPSLGQPGTVLLIWLVVFAIPGPRAAMFNGLPFAGVGELLVLVMAGVLLLRRSTRAGGLDALRGSHSVRRALVAGGLVVLLLKASIGIVAPSSGLFQACFFHLTPAIEQDAAGEGCIKTFASLPGYPTRGETSADFATLNFENRDPETSGLSRTNWNLPFVNSFRYDRGFFPWEPSDRNIESFPFGAEFRAMIPGGSERDLTVVYVGEGSIEVGDVVVPMPPRYDRIGSVVVPVGAETSEMSMVFRYERTRLNSDPRDFPYATLRVANSNGDLLRPASPPVMELVRWIVDASIIVVLGLLLWSTRRRWFTLSFLTPLVATAGAIWAERAVDAVSRLPLEPSVLVIAALVAARAVGRLRNAWSLVWPAACVAVHLVWIEFSVIARFTVPIDYVAVRTRGNDQLVYRAFVQEMLNSGFLRGGEDVFYFQPGIRYLLYTLHWLFGSGDVVVGAAIAFGALAAIIALASVLRPVKGMRNGLLVVGMLALVIWWSSSQTIQTMILGLSEFGVWPLLILVFALIARGMSSVRVDALIGLVLALMVWIRPNQGVAALALLVYWMVVTSSRRRDIRAALLPAGVFGAVLLLVPLHNLLYGGRLVLLPGGHLNADQVGWTAVFTVLDDESTRRFFVDQVRGILYLPTILPSIYSMKLGIAFLVFSVLFVVGLVWSMIGRDRPRWSPLLLAAAVVGQLLPFFNYSVFRYFPVHVVAIQLTAVLAGLVLLTDPGRRESVSGGPAALDPSIGNSPSRDESRRLEHDS